jgi:hypothetical protein
MPANRSRTAFLRTIGGLDDPRRGDERSNRVWADARAVAQQAQFYAALLVAAVMAWFLAKPDVYWTIPVIWIAALGNVVTSAYLAGRGAAIIPAWRRLVSPRGLPAVAPACGMGDRLRASDRWRLGRHGSCGAVRHRARARRHRLAGGDLLAVAARGAI